LGYDSLLNELIQEEERLRRVNGGFTLIELMIVVAIIGIIASIAIPGMLSSQRAANERNAASSLKVISSGQADFRGNDRDGNKINDFWTRDVSGLYGVCPDGSSEMIKLIDMLVAAADSNPGEPGATPPAGGTETGQGFYCIKAPKAGYWFRPLQNDEDGSTYQTDTGGGVWAGNPFFHLSKFSCEGYPDSRSAGRLYFILNEGNSLFKRTVAANYARPATNAAVSSLGGTAGAITQYPDETSLKSDYSKMD
jgi:prepilin-type N-terminal cleavage/methylation domain-containing protein